MLEINDISFSYGNHVVIDRLSLNLESGLIHGLIGLNGEGKTTLLNLIANRLKLNSGKINWNNEKPIHAAISYLESDPYFFPKITGEEYLKIFKHREPGFDYLKWNSVFDLPLKELIENYSSGMKKKLAIISVMSFDSPLLLLDEPFNNLDLETSLILENLLIQLKNSGKTILLTSHILETLTESCDKIHHLKQNKIDRTYQKSEFENIKKVLLSAKIESASEQMRSLLT